MSLSEEEVQRYSRHLLMEEFGEGSQLKLKAAKVLVVGAGGLGCPCLLYLAAAGIGHIGIADDDLISISNLQRQVLFDTQDVGKTKAETAREKLLKKNPLIQIQLHGRITKDNALQVIPEYDLVVDGSDNFSTRYLLNDACVITGKPYIYGALFKFEGQVSTFNYQDGPTYRCLYPNAPSPGDVPACGEVGVLGVLPGIIGTWQATEAIKVITGMGEPLSGKLLVFNLLSNNVDSLAFKADSGNKSISELGLYEGFCEVEIRSIDGKTFNTWLGTDDFEVVDVREEDEFERFNIGGQNFPLSELEGSLDTVRFAKRTVVICQTGTRSLKGLRILQIAYPEKEIYHLKGGLQDLQ